MACTPTEEDITFDSNATLRFSTDTVLFDTLFTTVGSITRRFRIYNDNDNALLISSISLQGGTDSPYTLFVNGRAGASFEDVRILGNDSLLLLTEVTIDPQNEDLPFLVRDQVNFETNGNQQDVKLVAFGQDANFLGDSILSCNTVWTAGKPYVITSSILVDTLCNLTIEPGARIFASNNAFIFVRGTLKVNGNVDQPVLFRNDRLDESFDIAPGQWGGLVFLEGSKDNEISFSTIKNAQVGVRLGTPDDDTIPDLIINNSIIENIGSSSDFPDNAINLQPGHGILAFTSDLEVNNTLINNCELGSIGNFAGGNYTYNHCTLANFSFDFFRQDPTATISDNIILGDNSLLLGDLDLNITNSIIYGNLGDELLLSITAETNSQVTLSNNLIRTTEESFEAGGNILNEDPKFIDAREFNFRLDTLSPAKDAGLVIGILTDLEGKTRDEKPDIGAYERIEE